VETSEELPTDLDLDFSGLEIEEEAPKRTRKPRADAGKPRGRRPSNATLKSQLLVPWATVALAVSQPLPLVGAVMTVRGEPTIDALLALAGDHPKMMAALKTAAKAGPASELLQTGALMMMAAMIEIGRVKPDMGIAQASGLTGMYYELHPDQAPEEEAPQFPFTAPGMDFPANAA
jgi:hypothetical protein